VESELVSIGYVIKTHGVRGQLRIAFAENIKELSETEALYFLVKGSQVPFFIKEITYFKNGDALVLLEDVNNMEDAGRFTKKELYGPEGYIAEEAYEDEDPWVGFVITDEKLGLLGTVTGSIDMGEYFLLELLFNEKPIIIPLHDVMIINLDEENKQIITHLPEGLINI